MDLAAAGLHEQPFRTHGRPLVAMNYAAFKAGQDALRDMLDCRHGLVLLQGPPLSGKSTLIREFADSLDRRCEVAIVDGRGLNTLGLLSALLRQFGYEIDSNSTGELLGMLRVFCLQQTVSQEAPLVVIDNVHDLNPSALRALCELAELKVRQYSALKMVLMSNRSLKRMMQAPEMECIERRVSKDFHLRPMSSDETRRFLHAKLRSAGSDAPEALFPSAICEELWQASGGWPGILDRVALLALARAESLPVPITVIERPALPRGTWDAGKAPAPEPGKTAESPKLVVTSNGHTVSEVEFTRTRVLIGRADHNDIAIGSKFVSRHHLLLVRHGKTTFMMDLNSTNGTFVNSKRVSNQVLMDGDILSVGNHRIKFCDADATSREGIEDMDFADTSIMRTLDDMRKLLAQENTAMLPAASSENMPTFSP